MYSTACITCNESKGFKLDSAGNCCRIENCDICNSIDNRKCVACSYGFTVLKSKDFDGDINGDDMCITETYCDRALKIADQGYFSDEGKYEPLIKLKGAIVKEPLSLK